MILSGLRVLRKVFRNASAASVSGAAPRSLFGKYGYNVGMRHQRQPLERPKINMTPMIDVVFLLLIFFVLTFRIIIPEGDFPVRMSPMGLAQAAVPDTDSVQVRLFADADGSLSAIQLNGEGIENFDFLRKSVLEISLENPDLEVELFPDENLHYEYVIRAITAVNGEILDGQVRTISDKIKFVRQKEADGR